MEKKTTPSKALEKAFIKTFKNEPAKIKRFFVEKFQRNKKKKEKQD
jgi:hypothetical protein